MFISGLVIDDKDWRGGGDYGGKHIEVSTEGINITENRKFSLTVDT